MTLKDRNIFFLAAPLVLIGAGTLFFVLSQKPPQRHGTPRPRPKFAEADSSRDLHNPHAADFFATDLAALRARLAGNSKTFDPRAVPSAACMRKLAQNAGPADFFKRNQAAFERIAGPWYYEKFGSRAGTAESSIPGKFLLALARGGFFPRFTEGRDDTEALRLFAEVADVDPSNSAPWLYSAVIEDRRNHSDQSRDLLARAANATKFDPYLGVFPREVFGAAHSAPDLIQAFANYGFLPMTDSSLKMFLSRRKSDALSSQVQSAPLFDPEPARFFRLLSKRCDPTDLQEMIR